MAEVTVNFYEEFKGHRFGGIWEFYSPQLFVVDPEMLRDIFVKDFSTWSSRGVTVNLEVDPLSANLVALDGKKWKAVRTKLTPTFTSGKLKQMHYLLLECGKEFEKHLEYVVGRGGDVEMREITAKYSTDVIGSCIFGIQMNSLSDEDSLFREMGRKIFKPSRERTVTRALQLHFPRLFKLLKLSSITQELTDFFINITKENFSYREKHEIQRHDFMDLLRSLKNTGERLGEDEIEFDDKLLAAQAFIFFGAGFETSSSTISFCLHELAVNKTVQDRLREEIHRTKAANNGKDITWDELKNMKYLDMVFQETLRKYPPFPVIGRTSVKSYRVPDSDVVLPEGTGCTIPIYAFHHDSEYYPDPEKFDPERFTEEAKSHRSPFRFIPFGGGPRLCIGMRFAEQQTKLALFQLINKFEVSLCDKSENPLKLNPRTRFLLPKNGIWLRLSHAVPNSSKNKSK